MMTNATCRVRGARDSFRYGHTTGTEDRWLEKPLPSASKTEAA
jgi:hypothetical protein